MTNRALDIGDDISSLAERHRISDVLVGFVATTNQLNDSQRRMVLASLARVRLAPREARLHRYDDTYLQSLDMEHVPWLRDPCANCGQSDLRWWDGSPKVLGYWHTICQLCGREELGVYNQHLIPGFTPMEAPYRDVMGAATRHLIAQLDQRRASCHPTR